MNRLVSSSSKAHAQESVRERDSSPTAGRVESQLVRGPETVSGVPTNCPVADLYDRADVARSQDAVSLAAMAGAAAQSEVDITRRQSLPEHELGEFDLKPAPSLQPGAESRGNFEQSPSSRTIDDDDNETILMGHTYLSLVHQDIPDFVKQHATSLTFPQKLMLMLIHMEKVSAKTGTRESDMPIGWIENGFAIEIRNPEALVNNWLPVFFKQTKFSSFTRKLYRWRFRQVFTSDNPTARPTSLCFGHDCFQRDHKSLLSKMQSVTAEGRRRREYASQQQQQQHQATTFQHHWQHQISGPTPLQLQLQHTLSSHPFLHGTLSSSSTAPATSSLQQQQQLWPSSTLPPGLPLPVAPLHPSDGQSLASLRLSHLLTGMSNIFLPSSSSDAGANQMLLEQMIANVNHHQSALGGGVAGAGAATSPNTSHALQVAPNNPFLSEANPQLSNHRTSHPGSIGGISEQQSTTTSDDNNDVQIRLLVEQLRAISNYQQQSMITTTGVNPQQAPLQYPLPPPPASSSAFPPPPAAPPPPPL